MLERFSTPQEHPELLSPVHAPIETTRDQQQPDCPPPAAAVVDAALAVLSNDPCPFELDGKSAGMLMLTSRYLQHHFRDEAMWFALTLRDHGEGASVSSFLSLHSYRSNYYQLCSATVSSYSTIANLARRAVPMFPSFSIVESFNAAARDQSIQRWRIDEPRLWRSLLKQRQRALQRFQCNQPIARSAVPIAIAGTVTGIAGCFWSESFPHPKHSTNGYLAAALGWWPVFIASWAAVYVTFDAREAGIRLTDTEGKLWVAATALIESVVSSVKYQYLYVVPITLLASLVWYVVVISLVVAIVWIASRIIAPPRDNFRQRLLACCGGCPGVTLILVCCGTLRFLWGLPSISTVGAFCALLLGQGDATGIPSTHPGTKVYVGYFCGVCLAARWSMTLPVSNPKSLTELVLGDASADSTKMSIANAYKAVSGAVPCFSRVYALFLAWCAAYTTLERGLGFSIFLMALLHLGVVLFCIGLKYLKGEAHQYHALPS